MIILAWILGIYTLNVFVARLLNQLVYYIDSNESIHPRIWFLPAIGPILFIVVLGMLLFEMEIFKKTNNWFTGKNWKGRK